MKLIRESGEFYSLLHQAFHGHAQSVSNMTGRFFADVAAVECSTYPPPGQFQAVSEVRLCFARNKQGGFRPYLIKTHFHISPFR
nr:MAG TPA: hypothetical protein [Caudoviricetes sp.]